MSTSTAPRTGGGWRLARGLEVMGLPVAQAGVVIGTITIPLLTALFKPVVALILAVPALLVLTTLLVRKEGEPRLLFWGKSRIFHRGVRKGYTTYQSDIVKPLLRDVYLPGPLAPLEMLAARQSDGGKVGWVWDRAAGFLTGQLRTTSSGTVLADDVDADAWVDQFGAFKAGLGHTPAMRSVAFIQEMAPSQGNKLRDHVNRRVRAEAPDAARELMAELIRSNVGRSAEINQWVSVTVDPAKLPTKPSTVVQSVADASLTLTGVAESLNSGGVSVIGRATPGWSAGRMRAAFDPALRAEIERELEDEAELAWQQGGPVAYREEWDHLRHDSGFSVTWALKELPRSAVRHQVLRRLMAPGRWTRRVAVVYWPYPADAAEQVVETQLNSALVKATVARKTKRDLTVKDEVDRNRATAAALEQAHGAGFGEPSIFVTVTTTSLEELPQAVADVETRMRGARLKLVRMYGAQMLGFCTTLGVGVDPYDLERRPTWKGQK
jgi:hypothetical protein